MKSTQPCQVHIPWVGEPLLRSFVQFSPYLFFNGISKNAQALRLQWLGDFLSPGFLMVFTCFCPAQPFPVHSTLLTAPHRCPHTLPSISLFTEKPAFCYTVSAREGSQHCGAHSLLGWARNLVYLGFLQSWDNCELTVYKVIVLYYFNFRLCFFSEFFYLQHNNIITDIWLSLIISLVYFSSQFKTSIPPKTNNIQSNY